MRDLRSGRPSVIDIESSRGPPWPPHRSVDPATSRRSTSDCSDRCRSRRMGSARPSCRRRRWSCSATSWSTVTVGIPARRSRRCSGPRPAPRWPQVSAPGAVAAAVGPGRAAAPADAGLGPPCARRVAARHRHLRAGVGDVPRRTGRSAGPAPTQVRWRKRSSSTEGDLIETLYSDWCIYERDRLQLVYLAMLEKLMGYCEDRQRYPQGIAYGQRILRYDPAAGDHPPAPDSPALSRRRPDHGVAPVRPGPRKPSAGRSPAWLRPPNDRAQPDQVRADHLDASARPVEPGGGLLGQALQVPRPAPGQPAAGAPARRVDPQHQPVRRHEETVRETGVRFGSASREARP